MTEAGIAARSLAAAVERLSPDVISLTQKLIRAPSPNPPGDERAPVAVVQKYLEGLPAVASSVLGPTPERPTVVFAAGTTGPSLALAAHLDTHPVHGDWSCDPFAAELVGATITGLGATDNKGAVAAMAVVFRAFAESGHADEARLLLIANADEETGGRSGIEVVRDQMSDLPDAVVVAEPSGIETSFERLYVAARGTSRFQISLNGTETHSSLADHSGVANALQQLQELLQVFREQLGVLAQEHPHYSLGPVLIPVRIEGGRGFGVIPAEASAQLELRVTPGFSQQQIEHEVQTALDKACAALGIEAMLYFAEGSLRWMAPSEVALEAPIVVAAAQAWEDVFGEAPELGCFPGGTDARLFSERGLPTLSGVGPGALFRAHHPDEFVTVDELEHAVRLYARIVARYLNLKDTG